MTKMQNINNAMQVIEASSKDLVRRIPFPFEVFLEILLSRPRAVIRNVFQLFYDMIKTHVDEGIDEYEDDPESIHYAHYDCSRLFIQGADHPFFADRLFANRLLSGLEAMRAGSQQNKIYVFLGPPGSGKSTFLNNLLKKFEEYANSEASSCFEIFWRLDSKTFGVQREEWYEKLRRTSESFENRFDVQGEQENEQENEQEKDEPIIDLPLSHDNSNSSNQGESYIEIPCPSHDHPILIIPKHIRQEFLQNLLIDNNFKLELFSDKQYEWVFRNEPCTICSSLYGALLERLKSPVEVFKMIFVRSYLFNRRIGEGISIFNPNDQPMKQNVLTSSTLQKKINNLFEGTNRVRYVYSRYAKTNNGIYALMDIKANNTCRFIDLHNILSEGIHKVEDTEESVNSLFLALLNPEDKKNIEEFQSFSDRIEYIHIPYVMDLNTEVHIYRDVFGEHIDDHFLPRVLHNFARVIISSRLAQKSEAMLEWIEKPGKYNLYCDENLQLLKMEIYTGHIPPWLTEEDLKRFTAKRRRRIIRESENEGDQGFSGRDSIKIFGDFFSKYSQQGRLINMANLYHYFTQVRKDLKEAVPKELLKSLIRLYDYTALQEVKEALYYYNEEQISKDIQNYMYSVNFEPGSVDICKYTSDRLEITEEFWEGIESRILGGKADKNSKRNLRQDTQKEYTSRTLPQEIMLEGKLIVQTRLYQSLFERYVHHLKENVLDPFLKNENFRGAINDFGSENFKTYDQRIRDDVIFLIKNLCTKSRYTRQSAQEVCMYVIDHELASKVS